MGNLNYLNVGCGSKFHKDWVNIDMVSYSPHVKTCNLIKGIPYPDNQFDVVYHSQVLEHIPREHAAKFINECFRVIKPGGIIRIVVPDLENIVNEYQKHLKQNLENPTEHSEANYEWNVMELYDQAVSNYRGGQVTKHLSQIKLVNEKYIMDRMGHSGMNTRKNQLMSTKEKINKVLGSREVQLKAVRLVLSKVRDFFSSKHAKIGAHRLGGEVHYWMYDRYSLSMLLKSCGFVNTEVKNPFESNIPNWSDYELDIRNGIVYDPISLFMEARKPLSNGRYESN
jgi:predicted SAM-dependent methyltransferase